VTLVVLGLVGAGSQLLPPDASRAVERPALTAPGASATPTPTAPAASPSPSPRATRTPPPSRSADQRAAGLRADGSAYRVPAKGDGRFTVARQARKSTARSGRVIRFDVRVEHGLAVDADQAALLMARVLDDERSWRGIERVRFQLVPRGAEADLHAYVATPGTTDRLCAPLLTRGSVSCQNGVRVVLNAKRWVGGAEAYGRDTVGYRRYLVNHEFGHALGRQHVGCPRKGRPAPVMLQQTKGLDGCRANPWPTRTRG
jgi:uncharacterized protein DUF3152